MNVALFPREPLLGSMVWEALLGSPGYKQRREAWLDVAEACFVDLHTNDDVNHHCPYPIQLVAVYYNLVLLIYRAA